MANIYRLKELLKEKGMTQTALAEKVGLTQTSITRIVNGDQQPKPDILLEIAKVLDVDLRDLFVSTKDKNETELFVKRGDSYKRVGSIDLSK